MNIKKLEKIFSETSTQFCESNPLATNLGVRLAGIRGVVDAMRDHLDTIYAQCGRSWEGKLAESVFNEIIREEAKP